MKNTEDQVIEKIRLFFKNFRPLHEALYGSLFSTFHFLPVYTSAQNVWCCQQH